MDTSQRISNSKCEIFLGLCRALSGSTNVAKRLDVIVYPGHIRRVTGHALAECATSIRFQLITARTWCVGSLATPHCPRPSRIPPTVFVLQSLSQSSIQFRIPIHPSNVGLRVRLDDNIGRATGTTRQTNKPLLAKVPTRQKINLLFTKTHNKEIVLGQTMKQSC